MTVAIKQLAVALQLAGYDIEALHPLLIDDFIKALARD
jgi:hypothetical protein